MTSVGTNKCQANRTEIYAAIEHDRERADAAIAKKASLKIFLWVAGTIVGVLLSLGGVVLAMSKAQSETATKVAEQEKREIIGQRHRETARREQRTWQNKVDKKLDAIKESIYTHDHNGSPTP